MAMDEARSRDQWLHTAAIRLTIATAFGGCTNATIDDFLPDCFRE